MKLEVHERISLVGLLPKEENYEGLKELRIARESFSFTPDEMESFEMVTNKNDQGVPVTQWNSAKASEQIKDIPVSEYITNKIRKKLAELERKGQLNEQLLSIYEKFVVMYR